MKLLVVVVKPKIYNLHIIPIFAHFFGTLLGPTICNVLLYKQISHHMFLIIYKIAAICNVHFKKLE